MTPLVLASVQHPEHWRIYLLAKAHAFTTGDSCNITNNADVIVAIAHERAGDLPGAPAAARRAR